jgi:hypothetical protein
MANPKWTDDRLPEGALWCDRCQGMGTAICHCGGDQCYCENNGEMECPRCHGEGYYVLTPEQAKREAEDAAAWREIMGRALATPEGDG